MASVLDSPWRDWGEYPLQPARGEQTGALFDATYTVGYLGVVIDGQVVDAWGALDVDPAGTPWAIPRGIQAYFTRLDGVPPRGETALIDDWYNSLIEFPWG